MKEIVWIDPRDIVQIHDRVLVEHGGVRGASVLGLFLGILDIPRAKYERGERNPFVLAGSFAAAIVHSRPFADGNRRTGLVACILFLELNGYEFIAREEEAAEAITALAKRKIREQGFVAFLRDRTNRAYRRVRATPAT